MSIPASTSDRGDLLPTKTINILSQVWLLYLFNSRLSSQCPVTSVESPRHNS